MFLKKLTRVTNAVDLSFISSLSCTYQTLFRNNIKKQSIEFNMNVSMFSSSFLKTKQKNRAAATALFFYSSRIKGTKTMINLY